MTTNPPSAANVEPSKRRPLRAVLADWWSAIQLRALFFGLILVGVWTIPAVAYSYLPFIVKLPLTLGVGALIVFVLWREKSRRWSVPALAGVAGLALAWYFTRPATGERNWAPAQARMVHGEIADGVVTLENVRNFEWRSPTDFTPRWETRTYDLDQLVSLDLVLTYFGRGHRVGHTCLSFGFSNGEYLNVSVESRRVAGEDFNALAGQFRRYELIYVFSDERDSLGVRALIHGERVHVYPTRTPREGIRMLFVGMMTHANYLRTHPRYYSTLFQNCTTTIIDHVNRIRPEVVPFDTRIWLNGHFDELCYESGWIDAELPFAATHQATRINEWARDHGLSPAFSRALRAHLHSILHFGARAP